VYKLKYVFSILLGFSSQLTTAVRQAIRATVLIGVSSLTAAARGNLDVRFA
jgi:hypothetical protein